VLEVMFAINKDKIWQEPKLLSRRPSGLQGFLWPRAGPPIVDCLIALKRL
jgi:hypothetical protein